MVQLPCSILLNEVKEKVSKLRSYGVGNKEIETALHEKDEALSPLFISKDYKLF